MTSPSTDKRGRESLRERFPIHFIPIVGIVVILAVVAFVLANRGGLQLPGGAKSSKSARYGGLILRPVRQAPPISLRNYLGEPVTLSQYRGKAVLVTFLYAHCPNVCPLIASHLHVVQQELGREARRVQIIAVSVDPRGDTPSSVATFLREHLMAGRMQYLIGSLDQLAATWKAWNVGSKADAASPEFVAHSALVYGVTASGKVKTIYSANFQPSQIVHDVPLLAAS